MKVVATTKSDIPAGTRGEVISFSVDPRGGTTEVYFRVIWLGRPGVTEIHHSEVEAL